MGFVIDPEHALQLTELTFLTLDIYFCRVGTVDLARNQLTKVEFQMFADLRFIDTIDLAENQISEVQRESFKNIYLTKVNLSHNFIEEMADNAFRNCENMTVLDLSHNYIYGIYPQVFGDNSYTTEMRLEYNYLTSMLGVPMDKQIGIKLLNVSHNQVSTLFKNYSKCRI
mgnify:FL=1